MELLPGFGGIRREGREEGGEKDDDGRKQEEAEGPRENLPERKIPPAREL